ncbi:thif family protein [Cryptosporidium serpentis]
MASSILKNRLKLNNISNDSNNKIKNEQNYVDGLKDNPYSRLIALQNMGVVNDYNKIKNFSLAIIGVGGVGSISAEMLVRCGIGKLVIFDYDKVELANMNRLFYTPKQKGIDKVQACIETLKMINPDIDIIGYNLNICTNTDKFFEILKTSSKTKSLVDLVISCVDNYAARITISQICNQHGIVWFESGISESAVSGHIQMIIPGKTACYSCVPPLITCLDEDETSIIRNGTCAASLPTTCSIIAGLLINNCLKYLLNFGESSFFLGYNALSDFFPRYLIALNPDCCDEWCRYRQKLNNNLKVTEKRSDNLKNFNESQSSNLFGIQILESSCDNSQRNQLNYTPNQFITENLQDISVSELMKELNDITELDM